MKKRSSYRIIEEKVIDEGTIRLVEDETGAYRLLSVTTDGEQIRLSPPVHSDTGILAEAREYFPDHRPFSAVPVDAT